METFHRIAESRLIPKLTPKRPEETLPLLAALCSGGIYAAEFSMAVPFTPDAIRSGSRLFPDLVLGAGDVTKLSDASAAIQSGARYLTSPGYSDQIAHLCREHGVLYVPQCTSPSELLAASLYGLSVAGLFAPHLWGSEALVCQTVAAFGSAQFIACGIPHTDAKRILSMPRIAACTVTGLPCDTPDALADICRTLTARLDLEGSF